MYRQFAEIDSVAYLVALFSPEGVKRPAYPSVISTFGLENTKRKCVRAGDPTRKILNEALDRAAQVALEVELCRGEYWPNPE